MRNTIKAALSVSFAAVLAVPAMAAGDDFRYEWSGTGPGISGDVKGASAIFAPDTNHLEFTTTVKKGKTDGFQVVFSPGPNPKGYSGELAALYFDASSAGTGMLRICVEVASDCSADVAYSCPYLSTATVMVM